MKRLTSKTERSDHLEITIVILIILVISLWIPYSTAAKEYRHIITKKASRLLTFLRNVDMLLRNNLELHNESTFKPKPTIYGILANPITNTNYVTSYAYQHADAVEVEHNSISTICIDDKPCVTTVCINDEPCHTLTSDSTNSDNSTNKKHMTVSPFPQENI